MIRKKHALGPRPDGWVPVFPRDKHEAFARKIMLKQKGFFACNRAGGARCRAGPWAFCKLRDDGIVPLFCPTCQNVFEGIRSKHPCQRPPCYFAWGCFRYFSWKPDMTADDLGHALCYHLLGSGRAGFASRRRLDRSSVRETGLTRARHEPAIGATKSTRLVGLRRSLARFLI